MLLSLTLPASEPNIHKHLSQSENATSLPSLLSSSSSSSPSIPIRRIYHDPRHPQNQDMLQSQLLPDPDAPPEVPKSKLDKNNASSASALSWSATNSICSCESSNCSARLGDIRSKGVVAFCVSTGDERRL